MRFTYTPSFSDFWVYVLHRQLRVVIWIAVMLSALFFISPFLDLSSHPRSASETYLSNLGILILPAIVALAFPASYWAAKKRWAAAEELREEREYVIDEAGVRFRSKSVESAIEWKIVKEATMTGRFVYLMTAQRQFHYFPLTVVPNLDELRDLLRAKVGEVKSA